MARLDHDVVHDFCVFEFADTTIECVIQNELVIRLILDEVAQPLQLFVLLQIGQHLCKLRSGDRRPAHDSLHPGGVTGFVVGQAQEPAGFFKGLAGLHRDCAQQRRHGREEALDRLEENHVAKSAFDR